MAYVIPKDPQVMAKKGALFIVADGMGGHAAGEVASEIAVDTISTVYYQDEGDDVVASLVRSIKRANMYIHQRAAENMSRSGMGTTCVAAVLRGDMAAIANVGDSRAYMVRRGQGKQVSQDHSWVEEQVRAGLLTQEQAKSHAQRNVITRSLGTQPDIDIDIFTEKLEDGDSIVLCSDGLSNMVSDEDLQSIVDQFVPQESVYRLIERANESGGADNITAIVIHVLETGTEAPPLRYPVTVGGREISDEATSILNRVPSVPLTMPTRSNSGQLSGNLAPSPAYASVSSPLAPISGPLSSGHPSRRRGFLFPLVIFLLAVLVIGSVSFFYWGKSLFMPVDVDSSLVQAHIQIDSAKNKQVSEPVAALKLLSEAQDKLRAVKSSGSLSDTQQQRFNTILKSEFIPVVQSTIISYNSHEKIITTACFPNKSSTLNTGSTATQASSIAVVQNGNNTKQFKYTLGENQSLYRLDDQQSLVDPFKFADNTKVVAMTSTKQSVIVITALQNAYSLHNLIPGDDGKLKDDTVDLGEATRDGWEPKLVTTWDGAGEREIYVVLASSNVQNQARIANYSFVDGKPKLNTANTISVSSNPVSIAAFPKKQLFLLFSTGSVMSLQFNEKTRPADSVVLPAPIGPTLGTDGKDFNLDKNVPKPATEKPSSFLALPIPPSPRASFMLSSLIDNTPHLFIVDGMYQRVLDLQQGTGSTNATATATQVDNGTTGGGVVSASPVSMTLNQQYALDNVLDLAKGVAVDSKTLYLLASKDKNPAGLLTIETNQKNSCQPAQ
jgi:serine/threonine protein phosphatase PrpC